MRDLEAANRPGSANRTPDLERDGAVESASCIVVPFLFRPETVWGSYRSSWRATHRSTTRCMTGRVHMPRGPLHGYIIVRDLRMMAFSMAAAAPSTEAGLLVRLEKSGCMSGWLSALNLPGFYAGSVV